jgi:hypothetical protein
MRFSIFPRFGAQNSKSVFAAFEQGAKKLGHEVVHHDMTADVYVIWSVLWHGRMEQNKKIWDHAKKFKKSILILEVGCLKRGETWKVMENNVNNKGFFGPEWNQIPNRAKKLGLALAPWTMNGYNILICGQHSKSEQWTNLPQPIQWLKSTVDIIKKHTDKPIVFRPHPRDWQWAANLSYKDVRVKIPKQIPGTYDDFDFDQDLKNAWAVVNPNSNTGVQSIIKGVPAFVTIDSLATGVGNIDYADLDKPLRPRREDWLDWIAHSEWTLDEIAVGTPISRIFT